MVDDDVLYRFRLRLFSLAAELGNVREACRIFGVHHSTYYRWRGPVLRSGLEMLRPRERRPPRMPNQTSQLVEQRVVAFALGQPGLGPRRISATPRPGALGRHRHQSQRRLAGPPPPRPVPAHQPAVARRRLRRTTRARAAEPPVERHVEVDHPGELVGFDCFHVGRLSGTSGRVWQYTAIDLASSYVWAELATTPLNPIARQDVGPRPAGGGRPRARTAGASSGCSPTTAASSARRSSAHTIRDLGATQTFIRAGSTGHQRCRRAGPADDPRGVLAAVLRPEPGAQADGARPGPRGLPRASTTTSVPTPVG